MSDEPATERPAHRPPRLPKAEERVGGTTKTGEKKTDTVTKRESRQKSTVIIRNRRNFPITVHIGREWLTFAPYEQKEVLRLVAMHADFKRHIGKRFSVKEIL